MLVRRCAKGHKIYIFRPRSTGTATLSYKFSDDETVGFATQNKKYIVVNDGAVVKRTDSWITAQSAFLKESQDDIQKLEVGKHTLVNGIATEV